MVIGLIIGLRITADQQRPEQTGGPPCETIRIGETDNSREKMQNVRGDSSAYSQMKISVTATIIAVELRGAENGTEDFKEIDSFSIPLGTDVRK